MDERNRADYADDEIDLGEYLAILRPHWRRIALLSLGVGLVTLFVMFLIPNQYKATAVITPAAEEKNPIPILGTLASFGIEIGGPTKVEDLETLFKSNDLTVRVFKNHNVWPAVFPRCFDPGTGKMNFGWIGSLLSGKERSRPPTDWDAIRAAEDRLEVVTRKNAGTVAISFHSPSAEGSANIVRYYLEEGKSRLQEEALERAVKNKKFIEEQIGKTVDALTRDRLYSLYGQEVEREMMAKNREQFGFRVIDSPRIPDRKSKPRRVLNAILISVLSFPIWAILYGFFVDRRTTLRRSERDN